MQIKIYIRPNVRNVMYEFDAPGENDLGRGSINSYLCQYFCARSCI